MKTKRGLPFKNIINTQVVVVSQPLVRVISHDQFVTMLPTGWGDYHVLAEDGSERATTHAVMTEAEVLEHFGVDLKEYQ